MTDDLFDHEIGGGYPDGTTGHSGSDTSQERAERERDNGTASKRQRYVLSMLSVLQGEGLTVAELREDGLHHGQASSVLSTLHKQGRLVRLRETRGACKVYVLPEHVGGRETEPHGGRATGGKSAVTQVEQIREHLAAWRTEWTMTGTTRQRDYALLAMIEEIVG